MTFTPAQLLTTSSSGEGKSRREQQNKKRKRKREMLLREGYSCPYEPSTPSTPAPPLETTILARHLGSDKAQAVSTRKATIVKKKSL